MFFERYNQKMKKMHRLKSASMHSMQNMGGGGGGVGFAVVYVCGRYKQKTYRLEYASESRQDFDNVCVFICRHQNKVRSLREPKSRYQIE